MPRTRRPRTRGKARNVRSSSPAPSNASAAVSTPPTGRRSAAVSNASNASKASGRTTQNSRGNRGRRGGHGPARKSTGLGRNGSNRGGGRGRLAKKDSTLHQDPSSYKDEDGEVYKIGGMLQPCECVCVCVDSSAIAKRCCRI